MSKGIDKVRKSIVERQKIKRQFLGESKSNQHVPLFPQIEEQHGYFLSHLDDTRQEESGGKLFPGFLTKAILSAILFLGVFILMESNVSLLEKPKAWTSQVLQEDFPFARIYQWYRDTLGAPLAFSPQVFHENTDQINWSLPVSGSVTEDFQANGSGIMIAPKNSESVSAWHDGVIIFAGNNRKTGKTVVIQHSDQSKTTYAQLSTLDVHLYQYISSGEKIGTFNPTETQKDIYFSIERDNEFIDPIQVINVDDRS